MRTRLYLGVASLASAYPLSLVLNFDPFVAILLAVAVNLALVDPDDIYGERPMTPVHRGPKSKRLWQPEKSVGLARSRERTPVAGTPRVDPVASTADVIQGNHGPSWANCFRCLPGAGAPREAACALVGVVVVVGLCSLSSSPLAATTSPSSEQVAAPPNVAAAATDLPHKYASLTLHLSGSRSPVMSNDQSPQASKAIDEDNGAPSLMSNDQSHQESKASSQVSNDQSHQESKCNEVEDCFNIVTSTNSVIPAVR